MHTHTRLSALVVALLLCLPSVGHGQAQAPDQLGHVDFANSCRAAVQGTLQRGVAMLHSFWLSESEQTFREVLAQDPACAIATWGIATALMGNPLAGHGPSPSEAQRAQVALAEGYGIGAPTQRERDYLGRPGRWASGTDAGARVPGHTPITVCNVARGKARLGAVPRGAEPHAAPDCLQPLLRCGFRQQVSASVRLLWQAVGRQKANARR